MPNSTVWTPSTDSPYPQETEGTRKQYNEHALYDDHTFYEGQASSPITYSTVWSNPPNS